MDKTNYYEDVICARATPSGASAIAVIRVSGKNSLDILNRIFVSASGKKLVFKTHRTYYGEIVDSDSNPLDRVLVAVFEKGKSFTGEESFEINCHGSEVIIALILRILMANGVRPAEAGEFSKRAFLNGRITLAEAESIMDIVHSSTDKSARIAVRQLSGRLSNEINMIKEMITEMLCSLEVNIDYPEEDLPEESKDWIDSINLITQNMKVLIDGFERGRYFREGLTAVILGKTNSGKSTLFNLLINEDKAIVSDIHGTTRDYLDGVINVKGYGIRVYDTAGLRDTHDLIEKEGTRRAIEIAQKADFIFYVVSAESGFTEDDKNNLTNIERNRRVIFIINKSDLSNKTDDENIARFLSDRFEHHRIVSMSALNKTGLDDFNQSFTALLTNDSGYEANDPVITNVRHATLIQTALDSLNPALSRINEGALDLAAFDLRQALNALGEITGEVTPEDIINKIFSDFCVGK